MRGPPHSKVCNDDDRNLFNVYDTDDTDNADDADDADDTDDAEYAQVLLRTGKTRRNFTPGG